MLGGRLLSSLEHAEGLTIRGLHGCAGSDCNGLSTVVVMGHGGRDVVDVRPSGFCRVVV